MPEPDAILYHVKTGQTLKELISSHEPYKGYSRSGDDIRNIAKAIYIANRAVERAGVKLNEEKLEKASSGGFIHSSKKWIDRYYESVAEYYQSLELIKNNNIWLPSVKYIEYLKKSGVLTVRREFLTKAIELVKGGGGFIVGLLEGFGQSIADVFIGIYDLVETAINAVKFVISGEAVKKASEIIDAIEELNSDELIALAKDLLSSIGGLIFERRQERSQ